MPSEMTPEAPDPDPREHVREQIRAILAEEDRTCLGVKARAPIPVSEEESVALAALRRMVGDGPEPKSPGSPGASA